MDMAETVEWIPSILNPKALLVSVFFEDATCSPNVLDEAFIFWMWDRRRPRKGATGKYGGHSFFCRVRHRKPARFHNSLGKRLPPCGHIGERELPGFALLRPIFCKASCAKAQGDEPIAKAMAKGTGNVNSRSGCCFLGQDSVDERS
jgi:hypothetical protein